MTLKNTLLGLFLAGSATLFAQQPVVQDSLKVGGVVPVTEIELTEEQKTEIAKKEVEAKKEADKAQKEADKIQKEAEKEAKAAQKLADTEKKNAEKAVKLEADKLKAKEKQL